jgi:hypothetical protein
MQLFRINLKLHPEYSHEHNDRRNEQKDLGNI